MRYISSRILSVGLLAVAATCWAQTSATQPATQPADAVAVEKPVDPAVIELLDRIEKKSGAIKTLQARLVFDRIQGLLGDTQRRLGSLVYVAGPPAKFSAHFDELRVDGRSEKKNRWYIFDGTWLVEKLADTNPKQFLKRQIVPPDAKPEQANPLALGGGPFVLPINMNRKLVLERFRVTLPAEDKAKDPAHTVHLLLKPLADPRSEVTAIDLWYDRESLLPVKVRTFAQDSENESIILLKDHKLNAELDAQTIDTSEPKETGWEVSVTPWKK